VEYRKDEEEIRDGLGRMKRQIRSEEEKKRKERRQS
jgi:hypothetical protein